MAAIVYFEKVLEDERSVTYRFGLDEADLASCLLIGKEDGRPAGDAETATFEARLAFRGILRGYRTLGSWPERGAGCT